MTHDQRVIDKADRIVNMVGGKIVTNSLTRVALRICRALAATDSLTGLSETTFSRLANIMTVETREPGETIVTQGEEGDRFYVVGTGVSDSYRDGAYDEEKCYGEAFGMISSYFKLPVPTTVVARTEMELYVLSKDDFLRALAARWLGLKVEAAELFALSTASISVLGYDHELDEPVIRLWNKTV